MTGRRTAHTYRAHVDTRDEAPQTPCLMRPEPFDALLRYVSGPAHRAAVTEVTRMCGGCELRPSCWREQRGEEWMESYAAGIGAKVPAQTRERPPSRDKCGTRAGYEAHRKAGEAQCGPCKVSERERWRKRQQARRDAEKVAA